MCTKAADTYPSVLMHVCSRYEIQPIGAKSVDICLFMLDCVPYYYKTQEICEKAISKKPFMIKYCLDIGRSKPSLCFSLGGSRTQNEAK